MAVRDASYDKRVSEPLATTKQMPSGSAPSHDLVIVGAGGLGREVYQWLRDWTASRPAGDSLYRIKGFLSNRPCDLQGFDLSPSILASPEAYTVEAQDRFVLAIGSVSTRRRIADDLKSRGARFITFCHPTAVVSQTASLGEGVIVCPFATVSVNAILEDFVMLNFYASCGHDARLGKFCVLSPYATVNGFTVLEDEVFMGTHSTVTARRRVGYRATIGANSVALTDVPADTLLLGVPGKKLNIRADD